MCKNCIRCVRNIYYNVAQVSLFASLIFSFLLMRVGNSTWNIRDICNDLQEPTIVARVILEAKARMGKFEKYESGELQGELDRLRTS